VGLLVNGGYKKKNGLGGDVMIYFVGAGPGDPEMITVKGCRLLQEADLVVYAGSLVNPEVLSYTREEARLVNSASLDLDEIIETMLEYYRAGAKVVRLHTGDASIYGAIGEQIEVLKKQQVPYQIIPGVSSFLAAAASLGKEYTVPEGSQTVIVTRREGRTPVPEKEKLNSLAAHGSSMVIFLSAGMVEQVQEELLEGYPPHTPVAIVYRASWPDEQVIKGNLENLAALTREAGITRTALIMVGDFLRETGQSCLYHRDFSHGYRDSQKPGATE